MEQHRDQGIEASSVSPILRFFGSVLRKGQRWKISAGRIQRLRESSLVTSEQAAIFRRAGAIGSHLEMLERNDGYCGFNQSGISEIVCRTDLRGNANPGW